MSSPILDPGRPSGPLGSPIGGWRYCPASCGASA